MDPEDNADGPQKLDAVERNEYKRIIQTLDYRQHLNLSAHLYSAFLLSKRRRKPNPGRKSVGRQIPYKRWTAWPLLDAPPPPQIYDDLPNDEPHIVTDKDIECLKSTSSETFPTPPSQSQDPSIPLLRACDEVLQRIINRRIHAEDSEMYIEPILEPCPQLDEITARKLVKIVDNYATPIVPKTEQRRGNLIQWNQLGIGGKAGERMKRLFDREVEDDLVYEDDSQTDEGHSDNDIDDQLQDHASDEEEIDTNADQLAYNSSLKSESGGSSEESSEDEP